MGVTTSYANIYVAWIENQDRSCIQYITSCAKLLNHSNIESKDACPYWRKGLYETPADDGIDARSGATEKNKNFEKRITLPAGSPSRFTVFFEIDRSFDGNDWWTDQPAILYAADVDLSGGETQKTVSLSPRGWSRNNDNENGGNGGNGKKFSANPPDSECAIGSLNTEMRYITRKAASGGTAFGGAYPATSAEDATTMTASLTLTATRL